MSIYTDETLGVSLSIEGEHEIRLTSTIPRRESMLSDSGVEEWVHRTVQCHVGGIVLVDKGT